MRLTVAPQDCRGSLRQPPFIEASATWSRSCTSYSGQVAAPGGSRPSSRLDPSALAGGSAVGRRELALCQCGHVLGPSPDKDSYEMHTHLLQGQTGNRRTQTPLLRQVHWELTSKNGPEHAAPAHLNWGSRGRGFKSRRPDRAGAVYAGRRPLSRFRADARPRRMSHRPTFVQHSREALTPRQPAEQAVGSGWCCELRQRTALLGRLLVPVRRYCWRSPRVARRRPVELNSSGSPCARSDTRGGSGTRGEAVRTARAAVDSTAPKCGRMGIMGLWLPRERGRTGCSSPPSA